MSTAGVAPHLPTSSGRRLFLGLAVACLLTAPLFHLHLVMHIDAGRWTDLYSPWIGTRAALNGVNPYSPAVTRNIQRTIYGHPLGPTESWDRQAFVYPATIVFFLAPFTLLPWPIVHSLFVPLAILAAALAGWIWLRLCWPMASRGAAVVVLVVILATWPTVWGTFQRQPSLFIAAAIALSIFWFHKRQDIAAAILLAVATVKPQMVILLILWLLLLAIVQRRWRFIAAFPLALGLLLGGSLLIVPHWIPDWIQASLAYARYPAKISLLVFLFGRIAGLALAAVLLIGVVWRLRRLRNVDAHGFLSSVALLLAATVCLMPANPWLVFNDLLLIPGVLLLFGRPTFHRMPALRAIAGLALVLALVSTPLCALAGAFTGYSLNVIMPPFVLNYVLPLPITAALLALDPTAGPKGMAALSPAGQKATA